MGSVFCKSCGEELDGLDKPGRTERIPCPKCGSTARRFEESCQVRIDLSVSHSVLHRRDDKAFGFEESRKGRTSIANQGSDGSISYMVTGTRTIMPACRVTARARRLATESCLNGWSSRHW